MVDLHCHLSGSTPLPLIHGYLVNDQGSWQALQAAIAAGKGKGLSNFLGGSFAAVEKAQGQSMDFLQACAFHAAMDFRSQLAGLPGKHHFELRFCPFLRGTHWEEQIRAIRRGLKEAETAAWPGAENTMTTSLVAIAMRGNSAHLASLLNLFPMIDGIDVAGAENGAEQDEAWLAGVKRVYALARAAGLTTTYHAGEESLEALLAILDLRASQRIGHGIMLRKHPDFHRGSTAWDRFWKHGDVLFELCPAANDHIGTATFAEVAKFALELQVRDIPYAFCSDNPVFTGVSLLKQRQMLGEFLAGNGDYYAHQWATQHAFPNS